ncbi:MAG: hypothetical protein WA977_07020 [Halobacteriota archaeon]
MAKMVIFDSDLLIDYFLAIEEAKEFICSFEKEKRFVTSITVMEVYRGARNKGELAAFKKFFVESFADVIIRLSKRGKLLQFLKTKVKCWTSLIS